MKNFFNPLAVICFVCVTYLILHLLNIKVTTLMAIIIGVVAGIIPVYIKNRKNEK